MSKKLIYLVSFVLVLGLTTTVAKADIADGLVGYWPLNEGGGATTSDLSDNGNDGTLNLPGWDSGKFGGALSFDGVDDYVDCGNPSILDFGTGDFTISAWIKMPSSTEVHTIFAKGGDDSGGIRCTLSMGESNDHGISMLTDDNSDKERAEGATLVDDGVWHHVVGMREGTTLRVCVDGIYEDGIATLPSAGYDLSGTSQRNALIGAIWSQEENLIKKFFGGLIDDVALWNRALTPEEINYLWNNGVGNTVAVSEPGKASDPSLADGAGDVLRDVVLSWTPGEFAAPTNGHKVYFGESFDDVNDAVGGDAQSAADYTPPRLDFGTTYYWRVDEVNAPPTSHIEFKGEVWSFTTEPVAYLIAGGNITATASSTGQEGMDPENSINGLGLDVNDLHSTEATDMWLSGDEPNGAWIEYELDKVYKLHEMWVWNSNQALELMFGLGCKDVSIEYSVNGTDYMPLADVPEFAQASGASDYAHNTTVDFGGVTAKYIRLTANSNWGGIFKQYGLSEVRFFSIPVFAREPSPDSGATDVDVDVTLGWKAGRDAVTHDVYLSSDEQVVTDGNTPVSTVTEAGYGPLSLDLGMTYYWKINEVNVVEIPTMWQGDIWNFSTHEYFVVDGFEDYNDYPPDEIWSTWVDGYGVPANGATVGYPAPDWNQGEHYAETAIVHGGEQAMPFFYDNTGGAAYSEGERTFAVPQDWTKASVQTLALYFLGTAGNTGQLYVKVNGSKVPYDGQASNLALAGWQAWNIELASFGVNMQSVTTLAIGIDGNGASGTLYFDDFRLYPFERQFITPAEPNNAGLIGHWKFDEGAGTIAQDSSGLGNDGTLGGDPQWVAGTKDGALDLDGIGDYVAIDGIADDITTNNFTVSAWIKTTQTGDGNVIGSNASDSDHDFIFGVDQGFLLVEANSTRRYPPAINDDQWHFIAYTRDGSTAYAYVDGVLRGTETPTGDPASETRWSIGQEWDSSDSSEPSDEYEGMVDDVRFYNYALSLDEVAWLAGRTEPFDKPF